MESNQEESREHVEHGFHKVIQGVDVDLSYTSLALPFIIGLVAILLTLVVFLRKKKSRNTVLILGLSDSGKTFIFSKFLGQGSDWECYKSMTENKATVDDVNNKPTELVDFPGAERLRSLLFETWLGRNVGQIRRILFLIDSDSFTKKARDIAEFLHDVLFAADQIPILICCNKQDLDTAKSSKAIRTLLEKELGLVCQTRNRTLESTAETTVRSLSPEGEFSWSKFSGNVEFKDLSALDEDQLDGVHQWIISP
ncbi:unnamed protein product [Bursaphelenchus xylophilus]|uniref:Signal recognition particle receptor subunit beta n=1 Tax=Bursaphelenchus xylophilus TaxID=6326 RepID=A0A1I7RSI6_BURXY|nr:unnamed protein product [Bursaphelenchus xylophilus]CAG9122912.1 unnamed protein product [Bursaphelenchus xylophilus]